MKSVLFDYGGTLDSDGLTWLERFRAIYKEAGLNAAPEALDRAFYDSDDNLPNRFALAGLGLEATLRLQVDCVLERFDRKDLTEAVVKRFTEQSRAAFARNKPVLAELAKRYRLGIVSNFYGNLESILAGEGLLPYFSVVADSAVVGAIKPESRIFAHALEALQSTPEEAVMVGDSVKRDMRGAENLGMRHVLIGAHEPCCARVTRIDRLTQLPEVLCALV